MTLKHDEAKQWEIDHARANAITRAQGKRDKNSDKLENNIRLVTDLPEDQKQDPTLQSCFKKLSEPIKQGKRGNWKFFLHNNILSRRYDRGTSRYFQTVLPSKYRTEALKLAHDSPFAGHMGIAKTTNRLLTQFYWPGYNKDITTHDLK